MSWHKTYLEGQNSSADIIGGLENDSYSESSSNASDEYHSDGSLSDGNDSVDDDVSADIGVNIGDDGNTNVNSADIAESNSNEDLLNNVFGANDSSDSDVDLSKLLEGGSGGGDNGSRNRIRGHKHTDKHPIDSDAAAEEDIDAHTVETAAEEEVAEETAAEDYAEETAKEDLEEDLDHAQLLINEDETTLDNDIDAELTKIFGDVNNRYLPTLHDDYQNALELAKMSRV